MKNILFVFFFCILLLLLGAVFFMRKQTSLLAPIKQTFHLPLFSTTTPGIPQVDHIIVIMMENKSYDSIVENKNAPYINSLVKNYSFADNFLAVAHPSLPNYLALIGGDTFGITTDCIDCFIHTPNLIDQLEQQNKTWKAYMESMPTPCFKDSTDIYAQKHNPFLYFDDIRNNPVRCNNVVPYTQLQKDMQSKNSLPNFIWISPNLCNDMHNCSVAQGDTWLSTQLPALLTSPALKNQHFLIALTWDEGEGGDENNIPFILMGNTVKKSFVSHENYSHYSLLHTIDLLWHMPPLTTNVAKSTPLLSFFSSK